MAEVDAYAKMLPPGFRWMGHTLPRIFVWTAIIILAPFTILAWIISNMASGSLNPGK